MKRKSALKISVVFVSIMFLTSLIFNSALAASTSKTLSTNFTLVNLSTSADATVHVQYIKDNGSAWDADAGSEDFIIPKNYGLMQIRQYFDGTMTTGRGSAVVSSSQELGAIAQVQARNQTPTQGAYTGYKTGSTKFYVPLAIKSRITSSGLANSQIIVQNVESLSQVDVSIDLINPNGTLAYSKPIADLPSGVSYYYDLADESGTNLPAGWVGSAVVNSVGGSVAVVSNFFTGPDAMQTFNGFPQESLNETWVVPLFFVRLANGLSTVVTVQNLSGGSIPDKGIVLTCTKNPNFPGPTTITVELPGILGNTASYSFNPVTDTTLFPDSGWGGSCRINAGAANVVAIVQMRYVNSPTGFAGAAAFEAIPEGSTDNTEIIPLVAKRLANGFASVAIIQNLDFVNDATVDLVYTPSKIAAECPLAVCDLNHDGLINDSDRVIIQDVVIAKGASIQRNHRLVSGAEAEPTLPSGWQGSLVVTSNHPVSGFVQLTNISIVTGDTFMAHNAFTKLVTP